MGMKDYQGIYHSTVLCISFFPLKKLPKGSTTKVLQGIKNLEDATTPRFGRDHAEGGEQKSEGIFLIP